MTKFEEFFSSVIDWEFIEYLKDKIVKYSDEGYYYNIFVFTKRVDNPSIGTFKYDIVYNTLKNKYSKNELTLKDESYWELYGLYYGIGISKDGARMDSEKTEELLKRIKSKCHKVKNWDIDYLTIIKTNEQNRRIL